jgi:hypothetical protein
VLFFAAAAAGRLLEFPMLAVFVAAVVCVIVRLVLYHLAAQSDSAGRAMDTRLET